jgi:hypothetical protein
MAQRSEPSGERQGLHRPESSRGAERLQVVKATMEHVRSINLRPGDLREIKVLGLTMPEAFAISTRRDVWSHTYLIDGEIAAMVGLAANSILGGWGSPWLVTGTPVDRHARLFLKETRAGVERMKAVFPRLSNYVHADYTQTVRWLRWLGFSIGAPEPRGPLGAPFCLFSMETN